MNASSSRTTVTASPHARKRGQTLDGKWTIGHVVGRGGTATVFEGQGPIGERVAVKILHPQLLHDPSQLERFQLEADLLSRLAHPAFTKVFGNGVTPEGLPYLVMELLDGKPVLDPEQGKKKLPLAEVVRIVTTVLEALGEMHTLGAIHRDIKPGNLHISPDGRVRVIDLGIARSNAGEALTMTGMSIGTPGFMAPEQALSTRDNIGPSTDVFAVGATAIVLLHGDHVRHGAPILEAATRPFPTTASLGIEGPRDLLSVFDRAVRYLPEERFSSAQAMLDALASATAAPPSHARETVPEGAALPLLSPAFADEPTLTIATPATLSLRAERNGKGGTEPVPGMAHGSSVSPKVPRPPPLPRAEPVALLRTSRPPPLPSNVRSIPRLQPRSAEFGTEERGASEAQVERTQAIGAVDAPAVIVPAVGILPPPRWASDVHPAMTDASCDAALRGPRAGAITVRRNDTLARIADWVALALESVVIRLRAWSSRPGLMHEPSKGRADRH